MANFAKIVATYTDKSNLDSIFKIKFTNTGLSIDITLQWTCKTLRSSAQQITQGTAANDQGINALSAVSADVANNGSLSPYINVATSSNAFQCEANDYGWTITEVAPQVGTTNVTFAETPEVVPTKNFQLTGYTKAAGVIPCTDTEYTIIQNGDGVPPFTWITPTNASTTLVAQIARTAGLATFTVTLEDSEGDQATLTGVFDTLIFNSTFIDSISVVTNSGGLDATVTVFMATFGGNPFFTHTYSIDGINFQTSNIFNGVTDGTYTLSVTDGLGCIATQGFTVDIAQDVARANPNGEVSNANTLRHVQTVVSNFQNLENTLYRNEYYLGEFQPFFAQPFQTNDPVITTQFTTNYDERTARIINSCNDSIQSTLTITEKSDNIGTVDKRDCIIYNAGDNQTGIYFTSGNIYDPDTDAIEGTYVLDGNLPEWGVAGNTVVLTGIGSFLIKQTKRDPIVKAQALIIDYNWLPGEQSLAAIAQCTYNSLPYEVYEFDVDPAAVPVGTYYTQIILTDSLDEYPALVFNSELFEIGVSFDHTNFIEYYDSDESGLDYTTGYKTYLRIESTDPYQNLTPGGTSTQYNNSNANTEILKNNSSMIGVMLFQNCPRYMIEKLNVLFGNKTVIINGLEWTKEDDLETINFDKAALKNATINLKRKNYNANKNDNILIDGPNGRILQETGSILY